MKRIYEWMRCQPKTKNYLYFAAGLYLLYLSYKMLLGINDMAGNRLPIYMFMCAFAIIGITFTVFPAIIIIKDRTNNNNQR